MKNFIHKVILTTFSSMLFLSLSLKAQVSFHVSGAPTKHQIEDVPRLLENMLEENPDKDIFFYVHGRSRTLEKELRRSKQIEENYILRKTNKIKPMSRMPKMTPMSPMSPMSPMNKMGKMGRMGWIDALDDFQNQDN